MHNTRFACVVLQKLARLSHSLVIQVTHCSLLLGNVDQACADGSRDDQVSVSLRFEDLGGGLCCVKDSVKIRSHHFLVLLDGEVLGSIMMGDSGVGDDNVQFAKILGYL